MFKKLISSIVLAGTILGSAVSPIFAQAPAPVDPWYAPNYKQFMQKVGGAPEGEIFGERYTHAQVFWIIYSLQSWFYSSGVQGCIVKANSDPTAILQCVTNVLPSSGLPQASMGPTLDLANFLDVMRVTRPASGVQYIADGLHNFHIVPEAYAQGFGYTTLSATQKLWAAARNMAYGLIILVFITFAFMIMFRVKLSPQTVIGVQSALPRIVIALIFITFSYAIAGLLIDLAYLVQGVFATFLVSAPNLTTRTPIQLLQIMNQPSYGILSIGFLVLIIALELGLGGAVATSTIIGAPLGVPAILGALALILVSIAFIISLIRILWLFLRTYALILIMIIVGPFYVLWGAINIGGRGGGVSSWLRGLAAQLSVFVSSSILIVIAHIFIWGTDNTLWSWLADPSSPLAFQAVNPFLINPGEASIGAAQFPGLGAQDPGLLGFLLGIIVILAIPTFANSIRDMISAPMLRYGLGIGSSFGFVRPAATYGAAEGMNIAQAGATKAGLPIPAWVQSGRKILGIRG